MKSISCPLFYCNPLIFAELTLINIAPERLFCNLSALFFIALFQVWGDDAGEGRNFFSREKKFR
ncbi:MAG: hypothetical protein IKD29_06325, partial [Lentisphaeria bacterium]|nr:hypothetical protein [Lentisphaeria bacterium]